MMKNLRIGKRDIGEGKPAYIIAEIGSNFDGDLARAKRLAKLAKECGADAYKIQNFSAPKIVSATGFKDLQIAFQGKWDKPVVEVYKKAEFPRMWVAELAAYCAEIGIDFLSSPYDIEAVDLLESVGVKAYKVGSGEIDNLEFLTHIAKKGKPVILACGAATMDDIRAAVAAIHKAGNKKIVLLQCVTNYPSPVSDANIRAMEMLRRKFGVLVGYSDHTTSPAGGGDDPLGGLTVPLGAVALGASVIEKHVTDDITRKGPDHPFALPMNEFKKMIASIRALERALGDGKKRLMPSEKETVVIQRRGMYAARLIRAGEKITRDAIEYLRPAIGFRPPEIKKVMGRIARRDIPKGAPITSKDISRSLFS